MSGRPGYWRYRLLEKFAKIVCPEYKIHDFYKTYMTDPEVLRWYEENVGADDYHSLDRKYQVTQILKLIRNVPGSTAEIGVYKGSMSQLIMQHAPRYCRASGPRTHHLYDSFEGLSEPSDLDMKGPANWRKGMFAHSLEEVQRRLSGWGDQAKYHKGWIPDCFYRGEWAGSLAFTYIDVDLYEPTKASLRWVWTKTSIGGIIMFDDYGFDHAAGHRLAIDEFLLDKNVLCDLVELTSGQAFIIRS